MHDLLLLHSVLYIKEVQKAKCVLLNFWFFDVLVVKRKLFKIVYYIRMRFNILQSCHHYTLQNDKFGQYLK